MRLHDNDPCPDCSERIVLRRVRNASTLFRRQHVLMCPACNFRAVARRERNSSNTRYLILAQEARVSAQRYEGKKQAALIGSAESWEKQARETADLLSSVMTAEVIPRSGSNLHMRDIRAMLRGSFGMADTFNQFQKPVVFALVFLLAGLLPMRFAVDADIATVKASEAGLSAVAVSEGAIRRSSVRYQAAIASHPVAVADVRPVTLGSLMPILLQDVQIADSNIVANRSSRPSKAAIKKRFREKAKVNERKLRVRRHR